jgi:hypothetical protein
VRAELDAAVQTRYDAIRKDLWNANQPAPPHHELLARAKRDVLAAREGTFNAEVAPIRFRVERLDPAALTQYVEALGRRDYVTVVWRLPSQFSKGTAAYADWTTRTIHVPVISAGAEDHFAAALHEHGHAVTGPCSGSGHYVDERTSDQHRCIACETAAWRIALFRLAPAGTLDLVHRRLRDSLRTYRDTTPATGEAIRALEQLRDVTALTEAKERKQGLAYYERQLANWRRK